MQKKASHIEHENGCAWRHWWRHAHFLPNILISPPYTSSYHFSSYLASMTLCAPIFMFYGKPFFLHRKTTAISKRPYYTWQMCNIWWKLTAARIWWWDGIEWQKARIASSMILCAPQKMIWWKFYFDGFFKTYMIVPPYMGDIHAWRIKIRELSL